jgi:hypothetical protein
MRLRAAAMASVVLLGLLLSTTGMAWAEEPVQPAALRGQVVDIAGDSLGVKTPSGREVTVMIDGGTRLYVPGTREPSLEDVAVGDYVGAWGVIGKDGSLAARVLVVIPVEMAQRRFLVQGHVAAVEGRTVTVDTGQGERVVITDGDTRFFIPGMQEAKIADVLVGEPVLALGEPDGDGALIARVVAIVTPAQVARHTVRGVVRAIEDDTLGLATRRGEVRVETDGETIFRVPGVEGPGIDDLNIRDLVVVVGRWDAEAEVFHARVVALIPRWPSHLRFLRGEVTGLEGRTVLLEALQGEVAVLTDSDTIFRIPGVDDPGLDDVRAGDKLGALVARTDVGLLAKVVLVRRADETLTEALAAPLEAATALLETLAPQVGVQ